MSKILLEQIINAYLVRYDNLINIVSEAYKGSSAETINIYIDMYSIIKTIHGTEFEMRDYNILASCVINMCGHYREFFWKRCNVTTNFYIVYSNNCPYINNQWVRAYNYKALKQFNADRVKMDMIRYNVDLLKLL